MRKVVLLAALGVVIWLSRSGSPRGGGLVRPEPSRQPQPGGPFYGLAIQVDTSDQAVQRYGPLIQEVAELGANTVLLSTAAYQENAGSDLIYIEQRKCPAPQQWQELFAIARQHRLRVIFMPILLLAKPRGSEWRGVIQPPDWNDWFEQYRAMINHFAEIAARGRVEVFIIGSELVSSEKFTDQWLKIIAGVRQRYSGLLAYSANWDHYRSIKFWDQLDLIGMTTYHKLADRPGPSLQQLLAAWRPIRKEILDWQATIGRPILFTEVGWCSQEGAAVEPWNYYHHQVATPAGHEEQRRLYEAFIRTWQDQPAVGGIIWWEWTSYGGGPSCYNYTPRGKPAEKLLRAWFRARRQAGPQRIADRAMPIRPARPGND
ncbi:MAG: hypothetical protein ACE5K7_07620 [Phycisphaerae bacterium]